MMYMHLRMVVWGRLLAILTFILCSAEIFAQAPDSTFWVPNGPVESLVIRDTTVILGGDFDQVSPVTGSFARVDTSTALYDPSLFKVNGTVYTTCRDSNGYVYVGGNFSRVGNQYVDNLFRIRPDGVFDNTFHIVVDGPVYVLYYFNTDLYIGGDFDHIDADIRHNLGSVNLDSGGVNIFDPNVNGPVYCMAADTLDGYMVIGGNFTGVGVYSPPFVAKVSFLTGAPLTFGAVPWTASPNCNGPVYAVALSGVYIYIGGEFTAFGNILRRGIAQMIHNNGSMLTITDSQMNGNVYTIQQVGSQLFCGGSFSVAGNQPRANLVAFSSMLALQPWNPGTNGEVRVLSVLDSSRFFAGGNFTMVGNDSCVRGAVVSYTDSGTVSNWNPVFNGTVFAASTDTLGHLYVGGGFFGMGGVLRNNLCAISTNTGIVTAWSPDVNAVVHTIALDGDSLYFAGDFTNVNSIARNKVAAIDLTTNTLLAFNPGVNGLVRTIAFSDSAVYMGGNFTSLGGQARLNIGKVDKYTSLATVWNPGCMGTVNSIIATNAWIYVAGYYSTIAGVTRQNLARLNPRSGAADFNWIVDTDDGIYHAEFRNSMLVIGGWFNNVNGQYSPDFSFVDTASLAVTSPSFDCDGFVRMFTGYGDDYFISGVFNIVNNNYQARLVAYDEGDQLVDPWAPFPNAAPVTMQATSSRIFIGGSMTTTAGMVHPYFQVLYSQWVTGITGNTNQEEPFKVYPVPSADIVTIEPAGTEYVITDLSGKIVGAGLMDVHSSATTISIADLAAGVYVITVRDENGRASSQRIIRN